MPRPAWSRLSPWIESLLLSYGTREGGGGSGRLKAHVIGVGQMSQSQAQGSEGPTGLLFLSDGVLQIPAILTASAWEHLQEQEDRECFTSLVNTTVCIQDYQLRFHMALEQTKCRFFLSVGELATTAAGPIKDNTPCCTTLPSIRLKICKTWRALLGQEAQDSQKGPGGFDLSELLGEWQHDCLQSVLEDVRERLVTVRCRPASPQPSTSTYTSPPSHPDTLPATSWDADRVRYKGGKCFGVPLKCLIIPEEDAQQLQTRSNAGRRTPSGLPAASEDRKRGSPPVCRPSETDQPSVDVSDWRIAEPAGVETGQGANENSPLPVEEGMQHEDIIEEGLIDSDIRPLSNPWDIFPPCDTFTPSDASPEATPPHSPQGPAAAEPKPDHAAILTSTQLPVHGSKESWQTPEHSAGQHGDLPPYQKPPHATSHPATATSSASVSPPEPFAGPSNPPPATGERRAEAARRDLLALYQESRISERGTEETAPSEPRKAKRKRSERTTEALSTLVEEEGEEAQVGGSPPSWLFDTQAGSGADEGSSRRPVRTAAAAPRTTPTVHGDGRPFSYSYRVSGQNLQDFSRFRVAGSSLHWAVKYLVAPKQTDNPRGTPVTNQTSCDRIEVTSPLG